VLRVSEDRGDIGSRSSAAFGDQLECALGLRRPQPLGGVQVVVRNELYVVGAGGRSTRSVPARGKEPGVVSAVK
jgi:hypothetical protein